MKKMISRKLPNVRLWSCGALSGSWKPNMMQLSIMIPEIAASNKPEVTNCCSLLLAFLGLELQGLQEEGPNRHSGSQQRVSVLVQEVLRSTISLDEMHVGILLFLEFVHNHSVDLYLP